MFKDILFPKICLSCGFLGGYICCNCQKNLRLIEKDSCIYCNKSSYLGLTHPACKKPDGIDGSISVYFYNPTLKKIIKSLKYRLVKDAFGEFLLLLSINKLCGLLNIIDQKNTRLQPIPLSYKKNQERGFNQSVVITNFISDLTKIPTTSALERVKDTKPQVFFINKQDRHQNMIGAFKLINNRDIYKKPIILIDDVVTSGSTVKEAAKTLKLGGAASIFVFTLAKG